VEASVSAGGVKATGHLRITAPAGFGRRHVAPLLPKYRELHPEVTISLNLSDRVVDLTGEGYDCAVRVGDLPDSSLISVRLADKQRLLETLQIGDRLEMLVGLVDGEIDVQQMEKRIRGRVKSQMEKSQREYYLNEQMKAIQKELGEGEEGADIEEIEKKIRLAKMPKEALKKAEGEVEAKVNTALLQEAAEQALFEALGTVQPEADRLFVQGDLAGSLKALAALKTPVDAFFDDVMVNAEDAQLRANRLGLLKTLHEAMNRVADLSRLAA
jgi:hypothetical protein